MSRFLMVALLGLLCASCGGGIDSYEEGMDAQIDIMAEMIAVLEGVTDQESAEAAVPEIEALGERLAEVAKKIQELPQPEMEELMELSEAHSARQQEFQQDSTMQMMKLGEYPELGEAFTNAMLNVQ